MAEAWYVRDEGGVVSGPFSERHVAQALLAGQITDDMRVRQSGSDWCEASRARSIFRQLSENGWYVRQQHDTHGPFTDAKLRELCQTGEIEPDDEIRRGTTGPWKLASQSVALSQQQEPLSATKSSSAEAETTAHAPPTKWSTEPIRHVLLPICGTGNANSDGSQRSDIVGRCQPHERLLLEQSANWLDEQNLLRVTRTNGEQLGCLSAKDTRQILDNADRGITHVVMLNSVEAQATAAESPSVRVAVVLCPPGTISEDSAAFIEQTIIGFSAPGTESSIS